MDFEYRRGRPLCLVARELHSRRELKFWRDDLLRMREAPFPVDDRTVVVTFAAWAEMECFQILGWPQPKHVIDLYAEHRVQTNGILRPSKDRRDNLLTAARIRGLDLMDTEEKRAMVALILSKDDFAPAEIERILHYCAQDVRITELLLLKMLPRLDVSRALWRGQYGWPVAATQRNGVPLDVPLQQRFAAHWESIKLIAIRELDQFGIFQDTSFNEKRFLAVVNRLEITWPRYPSGHLVLKDATFRDMALAYHVIAPIRELRALLGKMRLIGLEVDPAAGRNHFLVSPFKSATGRNQPSNTKSVFGPSVWLRNLIVPQPGTMLLYGDWSSQEYVTAGALSGDERMLEDCAPGRDPYIRFGQHGGLLPEGATKRTHPLLRDRLKVAALATLYGQTATSLGPRLGIPVHAAGRLLDLHKRLYLTFWRWQRAYVRGGMLEGLVWTRLGWPMAVNTQTKTTSLMNWPMQSHGAEMLRIAMTMATAAGIRICAPVHDALLVEAPEAEADAVEDRLRSIMVKASELLIGVPCKVDIKRIAAGERYADERGAAMWARMLRFLAEVEEAATGNLVQVLTLPRELVEA